MLNHKNIEVILNTDYKTILNDIKFDKMVYTGPIDYFFDYKFGKLPYRSIRFEWENLDIPRKQEVAVENFVDNSETFTRVTEYKYLTGQISTKTSLSFEYAQLEGEPYYPIPTNQNRKIYSLYKQEAEILKDVMFCGRLAEYQYYNMDQVVGKILNLKLNN